MDFLGNLSFFFLLSSYPLRNWMPVCMDCTVIWPLGQRILSIPPDLRCWWKMYSCRLPCGWRKPRLMTCVLPFKSLLILHKLSFGISIYIYTYMWIFIHEYIYVHSQTLKICTLLSWASLVAQMVKNLPAMRETWVQHPGREDPLEKEMATHSSILA